MYIQRTLDPIIRKYLAGPEYIAVVGARQAGKTTLLRHIQEQVEDSAFLTFEDVELRALFDRPYRDLWLGNPSTATSKNTRPGKLLFSMMAFSRP